MGNEARHLYVIAFDGSTLSLASLILPPPSSHPDQVQWLLELPN